MVWLTPQRPVSDTVNPIAVNRDVDVFTENKRVVCELETTLLGKVLFFFLSRHVV